MKYLLVQIFVIYAIASSTSAQETKVLDVPKDPNDWKFLGNETGRDSRISNGFTATNTQFPFVARLSINFATSGATCTGSLIARNWILSARHCWIFLKNFNFNF
jgi:Trypsin